MDKYISYEQLKSVWKVIAELEATIITIVDKMEEQEEYIRALAEEMEGRYGNQNS